MSTGLDLDEFEVLPDYPVPGGSGGQASAVPDDAVPVPATVPDEDRYDQFPGSPAVPAVPEPVPGPGGSAVPATVPGSRELPEKLPEFQAMPQGEKALEFCRHWVGRGRGNMAAKATRESHPLGGVITGQPCSVGNMLRWSYGRGYMPEGSGNQWVPFLHRVHSTTIGVACKLSGNSVSAAGDYPIKFWCAAFLLWLIRGFVFHHWAPWDTWPVKFEF